MKRARLLGSPRVSRVGNRVLAIADLSFNCTAHEIGMHKQSLFHRDAETNTREACATRRGVCTAQGKLQF
jgi:hypothetical protein